MELGSDKRRDLRPTRPRTAGESSPCLWSLGPLWTVGRSRASPPPGPRLGWSSNKQCLRSTLLGKERVLQIVFTPHFHFFSMEILICCEFLKLRNYGMGYLGFPFSARMGNLCWNLYTFVICPLLLPLPVPVHHLEPSSVFFPFWVPKLFLPEINEM